ncbi:putative F-box protein PP2-B12 [Coffea arabica]|uniref:F-box protein PP2-B12 n=1 Tax=Coffea arabica TaxID=13443 RepID=A0ABM4X9J3_COFAR|nr:F-box protein PP2-B10-like [Coffea arabica]
MGEIDNGKSSPFQFLPEGCVSNIISLTSPQDACGASVISVGFKSASESDTVWEKFLPSDYKEIISNSVSPLNYATKKHLYFHLCHSPILINNGKLSFWISKSTGKKCYMLRASELCIAWKDTPRYWSWTSLPESRFPEVAELVDVCWLDIRGNMPTRLLSLKTNYAAYLVFKTTENSYGLEAVAKASVSFAATTGTSSSSAETSDVFEPEGDSVYLKTPAYAHDVRYGRRWRHMLPRRIRRPRSEDEIDGRVPRQRNDGWQELLLGEFLNDEGDGDIDIKVSETKILNWKRGLILEGIELRPKEEV